MFKVGDRIIVTCIDSTIAGATGTVSISDGTIGEPSGDEVEFVLDRTLVDDGDGKDRRILESKYIRHLTPLEQAML